MHDRDFSQLLQFFCVVLSERKIQEGETVGCCWDSERFECLTVRE
jgi:hypothetical protein